MRYNTATLQHLPRTHSDHSLLLLSLVKAETIHNRDCSFKFQACWMDHKPFPTFMKTAWKSYKGDICRTMFEFKSRMEVWRREVYGSLKHRRQRCLARLAGIQRSADSKPSRYLAKLEKELCDEYNDILSQKDTYWQQKSNLQ